MHPPCAVRPCGRPHAMRAARSVPRSIAVCRRLLLRSDVSAHVSALARSARAAVIHAQQQPPPAAPRGVRRGSTRTRRGWAAGWLSTVLHHQRGHRHSVDPPSAHCSGLGRTQGELVYVAPHASQKATPLHPRAPAGISSSSLLLSSSQRTSTTGPLEHESRGDPRRPARHSRCARLTGHQRGVACHAQGRRLERRELASSHQWRRRGKRWWSGGVSCRRRYLVPE
jgi:hypothetical protein